jgi:hypothetical protein
LHDCEKGPAAPPSGSKVEGAVSDSITALERAEMAAFADVYRAAGGTLVAAGGLSVRELSSAVLIAARHVDVLALNRVIGLGVLQPATAASVADVIDAFVEIGSPRFFVPIAPVPGAQSLAARFERAGARHYNNWVRLHRSLASIPDAGAGQLTVQQIGASEAGTFGTIVATGFGYPPAIASIASQTVGRPQWQHYLVYDGATAVGAAAMHLAGEAAWFGFAATAATHRGRGAQSALIVRRLADAASAGCRWVSVETAEDTVQKDAPSFRNLRRLGFEVAYVRPNYLWTRPGA